MVQVPQGKSSVNNAILSKLPGDDMSQLSSERAAKLLDNSSAKPYNGAMVGDKLTGQGEESDDSSIDSISDDETDTPKKVDSAHMYLLRLLGKKSESREPRSRPRPNLRDDTIAENFRQEYQNVLEAEGTDNKTLLHHIAAKYPKDLGWEKRRLDSLMKLLLKCSPTLISKQDKDGFTALYIAFAEKHYEFVDLVRQKCPPLNARRSSGAAGERATVVDILRIPSKTKNSTCLHVALALDPLYPKIDEIVSCLRNDQEILGYRDDEDNTPLHIAIMAMAKRSTAKVTNNDMQLLIKSVDCLLESWPDALYVRNKKTLLPYQCLGAAKTLKETTNIRDKMKVGYMREYSSDDIIDTLYSKGEERTISLDLHRYENPSISALELDIWKEHLQFESVLRYIDLPNIKVAHLRETDAASGLDSADAQTGAKKLALKGRTDVNRILHWLSKKGVRRILDVTVEDDEHHPHSDTAIEEALKSFGVEKLDWKRFDLCSDVIYKAAPEVEGIHLYSSGNNAVLKGWCCETGLVKLRKLKTVRLSYREGWESTETVNAYMIAFQTQLKKFLPNVELIIDPGPIGAHNVKGKSTLQESRSAPRNVWLECMDAFAQIVRNNHRNEIKVKAAEVRVAIIDDGISSIQDFQGRIAAGKSFLKTSKGQQSDRTVEYFVRSGGHGTEMAKLICRVCPHVKLYIARLDEGQGQNHERQIRTPSAVKAVEWAIKKQVHIISMSWSISAGTDDKQKPIFDGYERKLQEQIQTAYSNGITMFGAASDKGMTSDSIRPSYPATYSQVITVGASKSDGTRGDWHGNQKVDFYLPGHDIDVDGYSSSKGVPKSGSSIATALAAGLAALMRYCVGVTEGLDSPDNRDRNAPLQPVQIKQAFTELSAGNKDVPDATKLFGRISPDMDFEGAKTRYRDVAKTLGYVI